MAANLLPSFPPAKLLRGMWRDALHPAATPTACLLPFLPACHSALQHEPAADVCAPPGPPPAAARGGHHGAAPARGQSATGGLTSKRSVSNGWVIGALGGVTWHGVWCYPRVRRDATRQQGEGGTRGGLKKARQQGLNASNMHAQQHMDGACPCLPSVLPRPPPPRLAMPGSAR